MSLPALLIRLPLPTPVEWPTWTGRAGTEVPLVAVDKEVESRELVGEPE